MSQTRRLSTMSSASNGRARITSVNELLPSASFSGAIAEEDLQVLKDEAMEQVQGSNKRKMIKSALMFVGVGFVAVAGFAVGYIAAPKQENITGPAASTVQYVVSQPDLTAEEKLSVMVEQNFSLRSNPAITDPQKLQEALEAFQRDGSNMYNLPNEFLTELLSIAPKQENRRLRGEEEQDHFDLKNRATNYDEMMKDIGRDLQTSATTTQTILQLWDYARVSGINNMQQVEVQGTDRIGISLSADGTQCYVVAQESDDSGDWSSNLTTGSVKIKNVTPISGTTDRFGTTITAYKGFGQAYNALRLGMWEKIDIACHQSPNRKPNMKYVFGGFSRGGAITLIAASALVKEGKLEPMDISVINWGCPRAISKDDAPSVQGIFFEQWRLTYKNDPVPSLPYGWMGVKHVGFHKCRQCSYSPGLDKPGFAWPGGDHGKYNLWLPNLSSFDVRESHQKV